MNDIVRAQGYGGWTATQEGIVVCKTMTTETAHRLTNYVGKCASIHGHSYKWEVMAALENRDTLSNGISIDFGDLKAAMRKCIYDPFDHALVLDQDDPMYANWKTSHESSCKFDTNGEPQKLFWFPGNPTAENFARYVAESLQNELNAIEGAVGGALAYDICRVRVWETANSYGQFIPSEASQN